MGETYSYIAGRGVEDAVQDLHFKMAEMGNSILSNFDVSKAFDHISRERVIEELFLRLGNYKFLWKWANLLKDMNLDILLGDFDVVENIPYLSGV